MNRKKRIILILSLSLLIFISICLSVGLIRQRQKNTNEVYMENTKTNNNFGVFAIMLETEAGSGVYEKSTTSTWPGDGYVFNVNLSSCENGGELSWNEELGAVNLKTNNTEKCYVYFDVYEPPTLANYIINNIYVEDGVNGLYYHDGQGSYTNADQEAGDNSYRYSGANSNNYVCFGSDKIPCPSDNLYRIIGIFNDTEKNQVKLIKNSSNGSYYWSGSSSNASTDWSKSLLNTAVLNNNLFQNNEIVYFDWNIGGGSYTYLRNGTAKTVYNYELETKNNLTFNAKIGLMYVSDYAYAASPDFWTTIMSTYNSAVSTNWMYIGASEWTISHESTFSNGVFSISQSGAISQDLPYNILLSVRPCFYLNSDVAYASGDGSQENPFRIE